MNAFAEFAVGEPAVRGVDDFLVRDQIHGTAEDVLDQQRVFIGRWCVNDGGAGHFVSCVVLIGWCS